MTENGCVTYYAELTGQYATSGQGMSVSDTGPGEITDADSTVWRHCL